MSFTSAYEKLQEHINLVFEMFFSLTPIRKGMRRFCFLHVDVWANNTKCHLKCLFKTDGPCIPPSLHQTFHPSNQPTNWPMEKSLHPEYGTQWQSQSPNHVEQYHGLNLCLNYDIIVYASGVTVGLKSNRSACNQQ